MNCDKCKKKPASWHVTMLTDGEKKMAHYCSDCGPDADPGKVFNLKPKSEGTNSQACPNCGITLGQVRMRARVGCANDYVLWRDELASLMEKVHGAAEHKGKVPRGTERPDLEIARLKRELEQVIKVEDYERAARLRDQIKVLEDAKV